MQDTIIVKDSGVVIDLEKLANGLGEAMSSPNATAKPNENEKSTYQKVKEQKYNINGIEYTFEELSSMLTSDEYVNHMKKISKMTGEPVEKVVSRTFSSIVGSISDTGVTAVGTVENLVNNVLDVICNTGKGLNYTTATLAKDLVRTVCLGKGNK